MQIHARSFVSPVVSSALLSASLANSAPADTVTYTAPSFPAFNTTDNFLFTTEGTVEFPYFNNLGGALVLQRAIFRLTYQGEITYNITNNGTTTNFGLLKATYGVTGSNPIGPMFGPPFGSSTSGPNIAPGQTLPGTAHGGDSEIKTYILANASPLIGTETYTVDAAVNLPIEVVNPAQFSAVYSSGFPTPPVVSVEYIYRCDGDTNADHTVDVTDLIAVITSWGVVGFCNTFNTFGCPADVAPSMSPNGVVNVEDLLKVITRWGDCPQGP